MVNKTKKIKKTNKRSKKGNGFGIFKKPLPVAPAPPLSTQEQLALISKPINEVKQVFEEHSSKIERLYNSCLQSCKSYNCLGDTELCDQLNTMIENGALYEWGNLCAHSLQQSVCKEFLYSFGLLELYTKNLIELGKKAEEVKKKLDYYNRIQVAKEAKKLQKKIESNEEEKNIV